MTRIDFYVLTDVDIAALYRFSCRLSAKAIGAGQGVVLHAPDETVAREVDELLWEYPEDRFIPHGLAGTAGSAGAPVVLTFEPPTEYDRLLVNLTPGVPEFFGRFDRVAEVVVEQTRKAGRERYRFYRDRGFPLHHHEIDDWDVS